MKKNLIGLTGIILILSSTLPGLCAVWDAPHKYFNKKAGKWIVYIPGTGQITRLKQKIESIESDNCGFISFARGGIEEQITSVKIQGQERINTASDTTHKPRCQIQPDGSYKSEWEGGTLSLGTLLRTSVSYHFYTQPGQTEEIITETMIKVERKPNACGFTVLSATDRNGVNIDSFIVNGITYDSTTLTEVKYPQVCWGTADDKVKYTPNIF